MNFNKKLTRDVDGKMIAGVLAGLARYTDSDVTLWRIGFVIGFIFTGFAPLGLAYIFAWFIIPVSNASSTGTPTEPTIHDVGDER
jgi:phage shock protein PspC (stress-responsive transcriptional regulator)